MSILSALRAARLLPSAPSHVISDRSLASPCILIISDYRVGCLNFFFFIQAFLLFDAKVLFRIFVHVTFQWDIYLTYGDLHSSYIKNKRDIYVFLFPSLSSLGLNICQIRIFLLCLSFLYTFCSSFWLGDYWSCILAVLRHGCGIFDFCFV